MAGIRVESSGVQSTRPGCRVRVRWLALASALLAGGMAAQAARVVGISPQGEVAEVRQVAVRFDEAVVPAGEPRRPAPYTLQCQAAADGPATTPAGDARGASAKLGVYDLREPLAAGTRCSLRREHLRVRWSVATQQHAGDALGQRAVLRPAFLLQR